METEEYRGYTIEHEPLPQDGAYARHRFKARRGDKTELEVEMRIEYEYAPERQQATEFVRERGLLWVHQKIDDMVTKGYKGGHYTVSFEGTEEGPTVEEKLDRAA